MSPDRAKTNAVLVVDDIPLHRNILSRVLEKLDFLVIEASSPAEAMRHLRTSAFHAVFLDWRFPDGTGEAIALHLRDHLSETRLVITSAETSPDMLEHFRRSGAHHIIGKHCTLANVRDALSASPAPETSSAGQPPPRSAPQPRLTPGQHAALANELRALRTSLAGRRARDAGRAAHNLRGLSLMLGLPEIARIVRELEISIPGGEHPESLVNDLENALEKVPLRSED